MEDFLVSIIIPVYNVEKYLKRCVDSVRTQTHTNLEIILIDDGSPDLCPQMCDEYASIDKRIKVVHQQNQGLSAARNAGTVIAKGLYLMYVDSDDFINNNAVKILLKESLKNKAEISICETLVYHQAEDLNQSPSDNFVNTIVLNRQQAMNYLLDCPYARSAWGKLYSRTLIELLHYPVGKFAEDMFVIHKVLDKSNKVVLVKSPLYIYNREGLSLTRSQFDLKKLEAIEAIELWCDFIRDNYPELYKKAMNLYLSNVINVCTYLSVNKDKNAATVYKAYKKTIKIHTTMFMKAGRNYNRDKIKALLIILGLYPAYVRLIRNKLKNQD